MTSWLCVAAGGALGAVSRYGVGSLPVLTGMPHYKTLAINVAGCLAIGLVWSVLESWPGGASRLWYNTLIAGFLGGFTTYSSFSLEAIRLLSSGRVAESLLYAAITVVCCLGACALGLYAGGRIISSVQ